MLAESEVDAAVRLQRFGCGDLTELEDELVSRRLLRTDDTVFHHNVELLLRLTGGFDRLRQDRATWLAFASVNHWSSAWRYSPNLASQEDADEFIESVLRVSQWIERNV